MAIWNFVIQRKTTGVGYTDLKMQNIGPTSGREYEMNETTALHYWHMLL